MAEKKVNQTGRGFLWTCEVVALAPRSPSFFRKENRDCLQQDIDIQQERSLLNVQVVVLDLVGGLEIVEASHLGQSGQSWLDS